MRLLAVVLLAASLSAPPTALASGAGGTSAPPASSSGPTGGTQPRADKPRSGKLVLTSFKVSTRKLYDLGRPARVTFRIDGRAPTVNVKLYVLRGGKRVRTIDLGSRATRRGHVVPFTGSEDGRLPEGSVQLKLSARDGRGRSLRVARGTSAVSDVGFYWHRFPVAGPADYGGDGGRFGADRPGHVHQGQDLAAPSGTPIVAPRAGVVQKVAYQAGGAGHYIVLRAAGENRTYVFMHLLSGSARVRAGQRVVTGQRLGEVGSTGSSSGPHLHFEIWVGAWFDGGRAIDPLPDLRRWDAWS